MRTPSGIAGRIAAEATARPGATAIVAPSGSLTYRPLDRRANALAHGLRALAVLKAGGAYLPLDPSYPRDRLTFMLDDARPAAVLLAAGTPAIDARETLALDAGAREEAEMPPSADDVAPTSLAYVIYTSGSTGRPKGVELTRHGLDNLVAWHLRAFDVTREDRAMQYSSPGFDAAVWEVWPTLVAGASLYLPADDVRLDAERLRDWIVAEAITIGFVPTPMAERLLAVAWPAATRLRTLLTGADTLHRYPPPSLPFALVNNYGPTECTVVATSGVVPVATSAIVRPSIGRAIDGAQVWILDERMRPGPGGQRGELYVGGLGVGRGYRNQPQLTLERFVPDPFAAEPGARLYRAGDLARRLLHGEIAFLGRVDDQIKIRGFRVEPEEIVAGLDAQPGVTASAVVARDDGTGDRRLVAYLVLEAGARPRPAALRAALAAVLPEYMVPSLFAALPALPISPNGTLDRAPLPAPEAADVLHDEGAERAPTPIAARLAAIIATLLEVDRVGLDDNFFLLGGHSLLGTQLIVRVRDAFGVELSLRALFDHPTVSALAAQIERAIDTELEAA